MSLDETVKTDDWKDFKVEKFNGLNKSEDPDNLQPGDLIRAENVRRVNDTLVPAVGYTSYHDTAANDAVVGTGMLTFRYRLTDGTLGQLLFSTAGLYRDTGTTWKRATGGSFSGDSSNQFSVVAVPWADVIVFTNGIDVVQVYNPATTAITNLVGPGGNSITAKALAIFDSSLILLNTVEGFFYRPQRVRWCDKGDITNWDTGVAGYRDLLEGTEQLMCGKLLGPYLIVYRERGIHRIAVSANPSLRFDIDQMIPDNGVSSVLSVASIEKNRHLVWGRDNFYLYDGGFTLEPIGEPVRPIVFEPFLIDDVATDAMFAAEDQSNIKRHHVMLLEQIGEVHCVYQSIDQTDLQSALVYRIKEQAWFTRKYNRPVRGADVASTYISITWDDAVGAWQDLPGTTDWTEMVSNTGTVCPIFASDSGGTTNKTMSYKFDTDLVTDYSNSGAQIAFAAVVETKDFSEYPYQVRMDWMDLQAAFAAMVVWISTDEGATFRIYRDLPVSTRKITRIHEQLLYESIRFRFNTAELYLNSLNCRVSPESERGDDIAVFDFPPVPVLASAGGGSGTVIPLSFSEVRGDVAVRDFLLYRSVDSGAYSLLATITAATADNVNYTGTYSDITVTRFVHSYDYYVVARDTLFNRSAISNIVNFPVLWSASSFVFQNDVWVNSETNRFTYTAPVPAGCDVELTPTAANYGCLPILPIYPKPASGKYYWEAKCIAIANRVNSGISHEVGFSAAAERSPTDDLTTIFGFDTIVFYDSYEGGVSGGIQIGDAGGTVQSIASGVVGVNDTIMVAVDFAVNKVWFGVNGVWKGSGTQNPVTNQGGFWPADETSVSPASSTSHRHYGPWHGADFNVAGEKVQYKFTSTYWTYTPPAGFGEFIPYGRGDGPNSVPAFTDPNARFKSQVLVPGLGFCSRKNEGGTTYQYRSGQQRGTGSGKRYFEVQVYSAGATSGASSLAIHAGIVRSISASIGTISAIGVGMDAYGTIADAANLHGVYASTTWNDSVDGRVTDDEVGGDTIMCAVDFTNSRMYFGMNGVWYNAQDPTSGAGGIAFAAQTDWLAAVSSDTPAFKLMTNTGGIPFFYTKPAGYTAWDV